MFKIEFVAATGDDIAVMSDRMARIAAALASGPISHVQQVSVSDTSAKRSPGRPRKSADPVDAYVAAGGTMPAVSEIEPPATETEQAAVLAQNAVAVAEIAPATLESEITQAEATLTPEPSPAATPANLDELRAQIRAIAQDRGALWLRPLLEADKVTKVSGLTEATMRAALEAAQ